MGPASGQWQQPYPYPYGYPQAYPYPRQPRDAEEPPDEIDYDKGDPVPPGYHVKSGIRVGLFATGLGLFGGGYLISAAWAGANSDQRGWEPLFVPVAGPFILAGQIDEWSGLGAAYGVPLVLLGLMQVAGVTMTIAGAASERTWLQRDGTSLQDTTPHLRIGQPALRAPARAERDPRPPLVPPAAAAAIGSGLSLAGRF